jgi:ABC-type multidrug transport system fused ATPase/permease subunit
LDLHYKQFRRSAVFLVFFAVFSSMLAWDWIMSIDVHWFSTLFGWYLFAGMWVGFMIFMNVMLIWLRSKGYYQEVTDSHMHDISKWMFAISMLWSYLWVSQFLLIWYANIPEEVTYLQNYDDFKKYIDNHFEMPDNMVAILVRFLEQHQGVLSKRALKKEFSALKEQEVKDIETNYKNIFLEE